MTIFSGKPVDSPALDESSLLPHAAETTASAAAAVKMPIFANVFFFPTKINIAFRFGFLDLYQFSIVMNRKLKLDELQRDSLEDFKSKDKQPIIVILDNIRSLNNVGSFFRTYAF